MADEDAYTWETEYEKTWEVLQEDETGSLQAAVDDVIHRAKRRKLLERQPNTRLGMMRHLFLVLDMSRAMEDQDLRPTRLLSCLKFLEQFIEGYFDQNPISQLGIMVTSNKRAEIITQLGGNSRKHITALQELKKKPCLGEPSLQNVLEQALQTLKHMPGHTSREILIVLGSLTSCDPGNINTAIKAAQGFNIQCSVIGLAAEVHICKKLCQETQGKYNVILDEQHFKDLLKLHIIPPSATGNTESSLIKMGFPAHEQTDQPSMCMCHIDSKSMQGFSMDGYFCPQCRSKYCDLPVECKVCGLTLVSAPHLARSYHHLFPLGLFTEVNVEDAIMRSDLRFCYACQSQFQDPQAYRCTKCRELFCVDCDVYIHESLHSCPGCASSRAASFS